MTDDNTREDADEVPEFLRLPPAKEVSVLPADEMKKAMDDNLARFNQLMRNG